jgi:hypothetical protein
MRGSGETCAFVRRDRDPTERPAPPDVRRPQLEQLLGGHSIQRAQAPHPVGRVERHDPGLAVVGALERLDRG